MISLVLIAAALVIAPGPGLWLSRIKSVRAVQDSARPGSPQLDPLAAAASYDLLAVSLRAGLPTSVAMSAVASTARGPLSSVLAKVAQSLELGADPHTAWEEAGRSPLTAGLARIARRSAHSGTALADGLVDLAAIVRAEALDSATARAARAGVLLAGPLGLCFLPAFLCLGVIPVIIGLSSGVFGDGGLLR